MRYLLMICADENRLGLLSPEEDSAMLSEYGTFAEEMGKRGGCGVTHNARISRDSCSAPPAVSMVRRGLIRRRPSAFAPATDTSAHGS